MRMISQCSALVLVGVLFARAASAQSSASAAEKATAEAMFESGVELMRQNAFKEACPKLEMSQRIEPTVGTLLYLGECYERLGRAASAWVTFKEAESLARSAGQAQRAVVAQKRAERLAQEVAKLTVDVQRDTRTIPGLSVKVGSVVVPFELDPGGVAVPVDPGEVTVEASAPGYLPFSRKVWVEARGRGVIAIPMLSSDPSATAQPPPRAAPAQPTENAASTASTSLAATAPPAVIATEPNQRPVPVLPIVLGAVGVVGVGIGTYFGVSALGDASDARDLCPAGRCTEQRGVDLMDDARTAANVSNVAFGVGAASLAAAAIIYFVAPGRSAEKVGFVPSVGRDHAGLAVRWQQ